MRNNKTCPNPIYEQIKGVLVLHPEEGIDSRILKLLESLDCRVLSQQPKRLTIKTSRRNLQAIKEIWRSKDSANALSQELNACISNIIIGSKA